MAWKPHFTDPEPNIDPFNAPDPIMPGGEPDFEMSCEEPDADDGIGRMARRNERKEPGHRNHRPQRARHDRSGDSGSTKPVDAPVSPVREETPPEPKAAPTGRRERGQRERRAVERGVRKTLAGGGPEKRRTNFGCLIVFILFFTLSGAIGALFEGCSSCVDSIFSEDDYTYEEDYTYEDSYDYDSDAYGVARDALVEETENATAAELEFAISGGEPYVERVMAGFSYGFTNMMGFTPEEAGIDVRPTAERVLARGTYDIDSTYAFGDATADGFAFECSSYFYITMPDLTELGYDAADFLRGLHDGIESAADVTDSDRAELEAYLAQEVEALAPTEMYESMEFTATADAAGTVTEGPVLDSDTWLASFASRMGAYEYTD